MLRCRVRAGALFVSFLVIGCAKADRAPTTTEEPAPQNVPEPAPTALPSSATETPTAEQPAAPPPTAGADESKNELQKDKKDDFAELETVAEAEKALTDAKGNLDTLLGGAKGKLGAGGATPLAAGDSRCGDACKAMSSLRRAASAVCRLAGDGDARCAKAKGIVKGSETRVAACKCES